MTRPRLKLTNETNWDTRDLRQFVIATIRACGGDGPGLRNWCVTISNSRRGRVHGNAYVNSRTWRLYLPDTYFDDDKWRAGQADLKILQAKIKAKQATYQGWEEARIKLDRSCRLKRDEMSRSCIESAARVAAHEIGHCQGLRHDDMLDISDIEIPWVKGLTIKRKVERKKVVTAIERAGEREAHMRTKLDEWEKKAKRAQKKVREYRTKVRYYDQKHEKAAGG